MELKAGNCKKCGSDLIELFYLGGYLEVEHLLNSSIVQREPGADVMKCTCTVCGYEWAMEPLNKGSKVSYE